MPVRFPAREEQDRQKEERTAVRSRREKNRTPYHRAPRWYGQGREEPQGTARAALGRDRGDRSLGTTPQTSQVLAMREGLAALPLATRSDS